MQEHAAPVSNLTAASVAEQFRGFDHLTVRQKKKWTEILLSFELTNKYEVFAGGSAPVLRVEEQARGVLGFFARLFLGALRPFHAQVFDASSGEVALQLRRRFRFYFHRLEVSSGSGELLGAIERRFSVLRRIYTIEDAQGREALEVFGPLLKPWTFELRLHDAVLGVITKRWSGLGKELFTDADNFGIEMQRIQSPVQRVLAFAALVLIDIVHFERSK